MSLKKKSDPAGTIFMVFWGKTYVHTVNEEMSCLEKVFCLYNNHFYTVFSGWHTNRTRKPIIPVLLLECMVFSVRT